MPHTKTEWRGALLDARRALPPALRRSRSATIAERVRALPAFAAARLLLAYEPIGAEVDPTDLWHEAAAAARCVYVPTTGPAPGWRRWSRHGDRGAPEPLPEAPRAVDAPALVLVPGVGFDCGGTRLGRGAGFYDRALARLRAARTVVIVGLAFDIQLVDALPADPWDQPVDLIVTETRIVTPRPSARGAHGLLPRDDHGAEEVSDS